MLQILFNAQCIILKCLNRREILKSPRYGFNSDYERLQTLLYKYIFDKIMVRSVILKFQWMIFMHLFIEYYVYLVFKDCRYCLYVIVCRLLCMD